VPSLKNSKQISTVAGKPVLLYSKTVKKYLQKLGIQRLSSKTGITGYKTRPNLFKQAINGFFDDAPVPCVLGYNFVRDSLRTFDLNNANQIICDLLVAHGAIKNDDVKNLIPVPMMINGSWYSVCRENPGVYLKIITDYNLNFEV
jgi:hypothetical protein